MIAISLGWGVQSFTLAAMSALWELPRADVAVHADTTHEASGTYRFAKKWTPWLEEQGLRVARVSAPTKVGALNEYGACMIPAYIEGMGTFSRQCTDNWKRAPIRRYLQSKRNMQPVELWLGISLDEAVRMKQSDVKYITNRWPLVEMRMTRGDCKQWLINHGLEVPPKSSCVFCPYHDMAAWREMKLNGNGDWAKAVEVDRLIRKARPPWDLFVHPARIPLDEVDLRNMEDRGQLRLWDAECEGYCGI